MKTQSRLLHLLRAGWVFAGALVLSAALAAEAGVARYEKLMLTDVKDGQTAKQTFAPKTKKIYLSAWLTDVSPGAKLKSVWFAEKNNVTPDNYKLDSAELEVRGKMNRVTYSLSKPKRGWPVGTYRLELFIDDKLTDTVRFSVAQLAP
jgi:hypothetical protein